MNIIMRSLKDEMLDYKAFDTMLFDVRYELAKSRIMDTNMDKLQDHLTHIFAAHDPMSIGTITIVQA